MNSIPLPSKEDLSEIQQILLDIAEEQIVRKKKLNLYPLDLFKIAKEKTDLPEIELFQNITDLYRLKWIVPGEGHLKDHVFDSIENREIYNYIVKNPGCDIGEILIDLNISFSFALKNLETLFIFGFIRARKYSQYLLYFLNKMPEEKDMIYFLTRNRISRRILKYLMAQKKPVNVFEIAQALGKKEIIIQRKLTRFLQYQIISRVQVKPQPKFKIKGLDKVAFKHILRRYNEL
ncbi:MAG: hypothetical protein ACFFD2_17705 [Promethearchaeota archaeon]